MKVTKLIFAIGLLGLLTSCGNKASQEQTVSELADMKFDSVVSSSAAVDNPKDSTHKFIRTAELKFKVKNVVEATNRIEDITAKQGGFVSYTQLSSTKDNVTTIAVSRDSSLETITYTVANEMTLRVPNVKLDSTLREIARLVSFLDYRVIKADDVSLQLLSNKLTQNRAKKAENRLTKSIEGRGKKLGETVAAEETLQNKQEAADQAFVQNLSLEDQMKFSTIHLSIYQRQTVQRELVANEQNVEEYEPGFFYKLWDSLKTGWTIISELILFTVKLWGLITLAGVVLLFYKLYQIRKKNS